MKLVELMEHINLCPHRVVCFDKNENRSEIESPNWQTLYDFIEENKEMPVADWEILTNFERQTVLILCF